MNTITIISFLFFTVFVGAFTYFKLRKEHLSDSQDGYFLGGRTLTGGVIAASLLMTNLNATNFVGMTAQAYTSDMSVIAWEVTAGFSLIIVALYLVPRYLKQGITTIPDFLESRFDGTTRTFVTYLFIISYIVNLLPPTLYAGALALIKIFDVHTMFGISETAAIWILVWAIGLVGTAYAYFGGLKAIAVSDTLIGIGLVVGGIAVPFFALSYLGHGDITSAIHKIFTTSTAKLNSVGTAKDPAPFGTLFTGMLLVNLYYWGTDQSIVQRALGARSLESAQKGVMLAGLLKVFTPLIVIIPGIIAFHIYGANAFKNPDLVYSTLVNDVLPKPILGFFAAVMFGAILSTFNGVLNSASTLFSLNIIKPITKEKFNEDKAVKYGRLFCLIIAVISMFAAPLIMYASEGIFQYFQIVAGFFNVPIFTIILIGYMTKRVPAIAAKVSLVVFVVSYALMQLVFHPKLHFLHQLGILFVVCVAIMLVIGKIWPRETPYEMPEKTLVDVKPWKYRFLFAVLILVILVSIYVVFSPLCLVTANVHLYIKDYIWWILASVCVIIIGIFLKKKYS